MPTAYKGKIRISCSREACSKVTIKADVTVDCYGCAAAVVEILDLKDEAIYNIGPAEEGIIKEFNPGLPTKSRKQAKNKEE
jgi:hypothetical protein